MIVIGENINATRKRISRAIQSCDAAAIERQIRDQDEAGATYIDLNAGTGDGDADREIGDMRWLIDIALETTEKQLSLDSANPLVIQKAAEYLDDRRPWLINSVKNERHILGELLPLSACHGVPVVALAMDAEGIPEDCESRIDACRGICEAAEKAGVPMDRLFFDPLVLPLSANYAHGETTLRTLQAIKAEFPEAKTTMGASNISFGLLGRARVNGAFLIAAIAHGLDSAVCDPTRREVREAILLGRLIAGRDRYCRGFTRAVRRGDFER